MGKDVVVYVKPKTEGYCMQCRFIKSHLAINGIDFKEVQGDQPGIMEMLKEKGFRSYPVTHIKSKNKYIIGFDKKKLDEYIAEVKNG